MKCWPKSLKQAIGFLELKTKLQTQLLKMAPTLLSHLTLFGPSGTIIARAISS